MIKFSSIVDTNHSKHISVGQSTDLHFCKFIHGFMVKLYENWAIYSFYNKITVHTGCSGVNDIKYKSIKLARRLPVTYDMWHNSDVSGMF